VFYFSVSGRLLITFKFSSVMVLCWVLHLNPILQKGQGQVRSAVLSTEVSTKTVTFCCLKC